MKNWNNQKQQIPTLEILPKGTKLTGVTAVIPVFFIAFGIMEMLQNIWGDAAPGHLVLLIGLAFGMLCCCAAEVLKQKKNRIMGQARQGREEPVAAAIPAAMSPAGAAAARPAAVRTRGSLRMGRTRQ